MRRGQLVILALFLFSAAGWTQAQVGAPVQATAVARVSPDLVMARMMSFDRNSDGRLERDELNERMHALVTRGDVNGDGALDRTEIHTLSTAPPARQGGRGGFPFGGGSYGFADQIDTSSRNHIEGSLEDLRLASPRKEQAQAVVKAFVDSQEQAATDDLLKELATLLAPEQLSDFKSALGSRRTRALKIGTSEAAQFTPAAQLVRLVGLPFSDPVRLIHNYRLAPPQHLQAVAAVERYKTRLRLNDAGRSELLGRLTGILSREERDDLRAALERRPVVASGITKVLFGQLSGVQGGVVQPFVGDVPLSPGAVKAAIFVGDPVVPSSVRPGAVGR